MDEFSARLAVLRPFLVITFLALIGLALVGASKLRIDPTPQRIFESKDEEFRYLKEVHEAFGRDDDLILFHVTLPQGIFSSEGVALLQRLHEQLSKVSTLDSVDDLTTAWVIRAGQGPGLLLAPGADLERAKAEALAAPLIAGRLLSPDGLSTLVVAHVAAEREEYADILPPVDACLEIAESIQRPPGAQLYLTGIPVARVLIAKRLMSDQMTFMPICSLAFLIILFVMFRDVRAVLLPLLAVGLALVLTLGLLGATGEPIDIINNVLPVLIFVIGISDAIHLLIRYRHELESGRPQWDALKVTMRHLVVACFLTSTTTAVGFGSLGLARIDILKRFGFYAAAGVLIAYVVVVLFVPLVLSYLDPALPPAGQEADRRMSDLSGRMGAWVVKHRRAILVLSLLVFGAAAFFAQRVSEENNIYEAFADDDPVVEANRRLERDFMGIVPVSIVVRWDESADPLAPAALAYLAEVQQLLLAEKFPAFSILDLIREFQAARGAGRELPTTLAGARQSLLAIQFALAAQKREQVLGRVFRPKLHLLRITAQAPDEGAAVLTDRFKGISDALQRLEAKGAKLGLHARLSGDGPVASAGVNQLIRDLFSSLLLAFAIIFPTMCLLLRSIRAGLLSMIPNVTPLLLTLGFMGAVGMDLRVTSVIVFTVSLGLAVDDTIHFMVRFREEWKIAGAGLGPQPSAEASDAAYARAIDATFRGTGGAIVTTTVLLGIGYGVLMTSQFPISRVFGFCMEITVLGALAGDLIVLPACLATFKPFPPPDRIPSTAS
jgi:predicted RND superfamily exporter protein